MFPRQDRRFVIEPHWAFVPRNLAMAIDIAAVWQRAKRVTIGEDSFRTLAAEDEFLLLCIHGGKEEWARFKWLADLAAFVVAFPDLDWSAVQQHARPMGIHRIVDLGVLLLHQAFSIRTPLLEPAMRDPAVQCAAAEVLRRIEVAAAARTVGVPAAVYTLSRMRLVLRERRIDRLRYVVRTIATPRRIHFALVPLPDPLHSLYIPVKLAIDYVLHPIRSFGRRLARGRG